MLKEWESAIVNYFNAIFPIPPPKNIMRCCSKTNKDSRVTQAFFKTLVVLSVFTLAGLDRPNENQAATVEILRFGVKPNYPLCTDTEDMQQISDHQTALYPMWTRESCVGWRQSGIVTIEGLVPQSKNHNLSGFFRIHVGAGEQAAVFPPERIDVYVANKQGKFLHVTEQTAYEVDSSLRDHWIEIPAHLPSRRFIMVIRPKGSFLFIDEIQWVLSENISKTGPPDGILNLADLSEDAGRRHREALGQVAANKIKNNNKWLNAVVEPQLFLWPIKNPFGVIDGTIPRTSGDTNKSEARCIGITSEKESLCFGIAAIGSEPREFVLQVKGDAALLDGIKLGLLKPVLAADGLIVYDPIMPFINGSNLRLGPNQAAYIWMTADFSRLPAGSHMVDFLVKGLNDYTFGALPVSITAIPWEPENYHRPFAVNWGYLSDQPVCRQPERCIKDMAAHGINVFVIHPAHIPHPGKRDAQFKKKVVLLEKDLTLLRGPERKLLLFLRWDKRQPTESETKQWVKWIESKMAGHGLKHSDWALYPVDEPRGRKFYFLVQYAKWIKEAAPSVQIYANPISTKSERVRLSDLIEIEKLVDIWQPSIEFVKNQGGRFFNSERASWWVYQNPPSPAKAASPLNHYRMIAWNAWLVDAKGVGFWAYGDTTGSSAWDDFDGRRPDFAVVYEGPHGPVSSRRWEAFREGIEDYQLLSASSARNPGLKEHLRSQIKSMIKHDNIEQQEAIEEIRRFVLRESLKNNF
jgi:hypothetical protein